MELDLAALAPLPYHRELVAHLRRFEPEVWAWASSLAVQQQHLEETRAGLLRDTYRLTPDAHGPAYEALAAVAARLEIDAPATLWQAGAEGMNAALVYLPGEVHVVLHGPILERLSPEEFVALLGHELAHHRLWSIAGGEVFTAARILDHTLADPAAAPSHVQTARLFGLYTEVYADRGAAFASGAAGPAISTLVKVHTGLQQVDPVAYLIQAEELEAADAAGLSKAHSHPETYLRAQAVDKWMRCDPGLDDWLRRRLQGPLSMTSLDLLGQAELEAVTRRFIGGFLDGELARSEAVLTQARRYFPDWDPAMAAAIDADEARLDDSVRDYLGFVMLDLALADPDLTDHALLAAARTARRLGRDETFLQSLRRDAGLPKKQVDALARQLKAAA